MIQGFALAHTMRGPRRAAALLLAVLLNLALVPCTMALEVAEDTHHGHDCCPPEIQLDPSDCCELAAASVSTRDDQVTPDNDLDGAAASEAPRLAPAARQYAAAADPPDPPEPLRPLHKLNCVYLK